ncbi:MAG: DUF2909 domain-containing protein [Thiomonas sp.]
MCVCPRSSCRWNGKTRGLFFVMKDKGKSNRAVYALTFRVGFSVLLFLILIISYKLGWIHPHDVGQ